MHRTCGQPHHLRSPLLAALLAAVPLAAAGAADQVQVHGFASQGWLYSHGNDFYSDNSEGGGTFDFNEIGVNFTATPVERVRVGAQLFASSLGKYGKDKVELDWGYGEYQVPTGTDDWELTAQAGRVKFGFGFYNDYRDLDITRTQVFLPMSVYAPQYRDQFVAINGALVSSTLHAGGAGAFIFTAYIGGQNLRADSALGDAFIQPGIAGVDDMSVRRDDGGALTWETPIDLRFKASLLHSNRFEIGTYAMAAGTKIPLPILIPNYYNSVFGAEYQHGALTVASEVTTSYAQILTDTSAAGGGVAKSYLRQHGAYLTVAYRFLDRWEALVGGLWNEDAQVSDPVGGFTRGANVALRCDITSHWLVKAEFQRNRGTMLLRNTGISSLPDSEYWNLLALKTSFDF